jgi:membrane-bound PQQ-dependent dehydrogenase (glucose/quinate/shikimate family)
MKASLRFLALGTLALLGITLFRTAARTPAGRASAGPADDWPSYGHDPGGMRFSPLTEITRANVAQLKVAWTFHTGDISDGSDDRQRSGFETTPLVVDGTLYLTTPFNRVIALDPETGKQRWAYDPLVDPTGDYGDGLINRGASTWLDPTRPAGQPCHRRIFEATVDGRLIALDAAAGAPCADFGQSGQVSLRDVPRYVGGWYHMTSPPAVVDDVIVVGSAINDNNRAEMPSGVVRAYDVRTGKLRWKWDPIPPNPGGAGSKPLGQTWGSGAGNAWSIMAVDPERHLVFVPTGSASPDFYGGARPGDDKWADSVVALEARTGKMVWGFQLVHHNLWDFDTACPPLLATLEHDGRQVPVVVQGNKTGFLYVLNRDTGVPVFPVEERPVPQSDVPGEQTSPTQPEPIAPPAIGRQQMTADDAWGLTPSDRETCRKWISGLRIQGVFGPPSLQGTFNIPGSIGSLNWGGYAFDPRHSLLFVNNNNIPYIVKLIPRAQLAEARTHGPQGEYGSQTGAPYGMYRNVLFSPSGLPCSPQPWGQMSAVDMKTGKIRWQVPLGSMRDVTTNCAMCHGSGAPGTSPPPPAVNAPKLSEASGSLSLGGPIVTAGGLVFVAGTVDPHIRAFDAETGKELWRAELPASAHATPMTYRLPNGKQYVVIAAGGHPKVREEKQSDALVAFALP